jgi:hypothetical protein
MDYNYRQLRGPDGQVSTLVIQRSDGTIIPFDPTNTDYQHYLAWLAQGNQPLPPDAPW